MEANLPGSEFLTIVSKFKDRRENSFLCAHVLFKPSHYEVLRRRNAVDDHEIKPNNCFILFFFHFSPIQSCYVVVVAAEASQFTCV